MTDALHLKATSAALKLQAAADRLTEVASDLACGEVYTRAQLAHVFNSYENARLTWMEYLGALVDMEPMRDHGDRDELEGAFITRADANEASRPDLRAHDAATYRSLVA